MGRHSRTRPEGNRPGRSSAGSSDHPTSPDIWERDSFYDGEDERPRKAAWALALCLGVVLAVVALVSYLFGTGHADVRPKVIVQTEYVTPEPETVFVTPKRQASTTRTKVVVSPGPTVYRTLSPRVVMRTVTSVPKPSVSVRRVPGPTVTACYEVWQGSMNPIDCP